MASKWGPPAGSKVLFTMLYKKTAMPPVPPPAPTFLMGFDSIPIKAEKALYDLAQWCGSRQGLSAYLTRTLSGTIADHLDLDDPPQDVPLEDWLEWQKRFREYLNHYG